MANRNLPAHGTASRYTGTRLRPGCRCDACSLAHRRACKERRLAASRGVEIRIDKTPVVAHIRALQDAGLSISQIGRACGKSPSTIGSVLSGPFLTVNRGTAAAILSVRPQQVNDPIGMVDATGTVRRVRALYALKHGRAGIAQSTGLHRDTISGLASGRWEAVTVQTATAVRGAYRVLSGREGTTWQTHKAALRFGWAPASAWDDEAIDDPKAFPEWTGFCGTVRGWHIHRAQHLSMCERCDAAQNEWLLERAELPPTRRNFLMAAERQRAVARTATLAENWAELAAQNYTVEDAAARLNVSKDVLQKAIHRGRDYGRAA
jgi:lambda repressor-like predicted transcriptional regulator